VGDPSKFAALSDERTLISERPQLQTTMGGAASQSQQVMTAAQMESSLHDTVEAPSKAAKAATASSLAPTKPLPAAPVTEPVTPHVVERPRPRGVFKSLLRALLFLITLGLVGAAAFFGGIYFQKQRQESIPATDTTAKEPEPPPAPQASAFEQGRASVDKDPRDWMDKVAKPRAIAENKKPQDIDDPEFLYFYGRALFLIRDYHGSLEAFKNAWAKLEQRFPTEPSPLKTEVLFAKLAAARKNNDYVEAEKTLIALDAIGVKKDALPGAPTGPSRGR
ncbi:MAG: hypothetical protein LC731_04755, partial [Acidobacteria bacterium]|nr:hypothetical protein [Acidobacteriota bacterium]